MRLSKINYEPTHDYKPYSYQDICAYTNDMPALPVNVYLPRVENEYNKTAVVCIHGGAWQSDLKDQEWKGSWMRHNASILADHGFYAVEITHRSIAEISISEIIDDVKSAFTYVNRVISERHGIERLYAFGDSAGGHLALMSAYFDDVNVEKIVACNPVSDLTDPKWQLGVTTPKERRSVSPLFIDSKTDAQIYLLHGDADRTVPLECSANLQKHFADIGIKCELEIFEGAAHAFILHGYKTPKDRVNEYMEKVIDIFTR